LNYYFSFNPKQIPQFDFEMQQALAILNRVSIVAEENKNQKLAEKARTELENQYEKYVQFTGKR